MATPLPRRIARALGPWFRANQRPMSWRNTRDPYGIWVSEIMLQQTRVDTVERYWPEFMRRFPTIEALASAAEDEVVNAWSGLGYYRRARLLHRGARYVHETHDSAVPREPDALASIPGIGPYTRGAIASIAFDDPVPLVDGNVARVLSRVQAIEDPKAQVATAKHHWAVVGGVLAEGSPRELSQALMELGATVCTPKSPKCRACPLARMCQAKARGLADRIPAPKKKAAVTPDSVTAWIPRVGHSFALVRRPDEGLLAGLWTAAMTAPGEARPVGMRRGQVMPSLGRIRHVFSHRIWDVDVRCVELPRKTNIPRGQWLRTGERPDGGVPSVTQKILRVAEL